MVRSTPAHPLPRAALLWALALAASLGGGCSPSNRGSGVSHTAGVAAALADATATDPQIVSTFQADVRAEWALAFDPAAPPGCTPASLAATHAARPCRAYLLRRQKVAWVLIGVGTPGELQLPPGAPADLGATDRLSYLTR